MISEVIKPHKGQFWKPYKIKKGKYCLDLATTTTIFLSLVFNVHWNVIDKNDFNEVQILFVLHWGHFQFHWIQGFRKLLLLLPSLNNILPFWNKLCPNHHSRKTLKGLLSSLFLQYLLFFFLSTITDIKFKALTRETSLTIKKSSWGHPCHG